MAKDIAELIVKANTTGAEGSMLKLKSTAHSVTSAIEREFNELGIKSSAAFDKKRQAAQSAYEKIKAGGWATTDELTRAEKALADRMVAIDQEQFGRREGLLQKFKANWVATTAAIGVAWLAVTKGFDLAMEAATGIQKQQAFTNLAASHGAAADRIIADLQRVSAGTISTQQLIEKAGTSMLLGIEAKYLPKMMEIARAASRVTGDTIAKSFEDLSLATARQSKMILDNLGIMVDVEAANKAYAVSLGKTESQLTDTERKQAFLNATMAAGQEIIDRVGLANDTMAEKLQRVQATMANTREVVGRLALAVGSALHGAFLAAAGSLHLTIGLITFLPAQLASLLSKIPLVGSAFRGLAGELKGLSAAGFETSAESYKSALDSIGASWDVLSGKIDAASVGSAGGGPAAQVEAQTSALKDASSALERYSKQIGDLGREQLRLAEAGFTRDLERQEDAIKRSGAAAASLSAPLGVYLSALDQVYEKQIQAQNDIADVLQKMGADQATFLGQQVNIATTEKTYFEARLKAWQGYYDKLKALHGASVEDMKKKQDDLLAAQKFIANINKAFQEKFNPNPGQSKFVETLEKLDQAKGGLSGAMELPPPERAKALEELLKSLAALPKEVIEGGVTLISSEEMAAQISGLQEKAAAAYLAIKEEQATQSQEAANSFKEQMDLAEQAMQPLQDKILAIGNNIYSLNQTITLSATDKASSVISTIKEALENLKDKTITITVNYETSGSSYGSYGSINNPISGGGSFATGTSYVPKTGLYQLHRGEEVKTRGEVSKASGPVSMSFGDINISLPNVREATPKSAHQLARAIFPELQKLNLRTVAPAAR
ncbi:hypothetical protein DBW_1862 [Desulfuromonas sp. DDH964]|uniref:hypothetical protein n=1 Tax=Desulfuromonas sp. DDH964 TaxID=1823759 RepID=UPI00078D117C|nr:hypothetical protein [Desulfuromonas sp. DDH964]AMV72216.1 hypothetical protein DBW_1862 [Desulfuromonas sp. DDH964]